MTPDRLRRQILALVEAFYQAGLGGEPFVVIDSFNLESLEELGRALGS